MYTLEDFNSHNAATKKKILDESNVVCCGGCGREFVVAKTATAKHCPFCGKELGKRVIVHKPVQIEQYCSSGIVLSPIYNNISRI